MVKNLWRNVKAAGGGFTRVANRFLISFLTVTTNKAGFVTTASFRTNISIKVEFFHIIIIKTLREMITISQSNLKHY